MTHCDDYIDDETQPQCLRAFLAHARAPAHGSLLETPRPWLFADYKGKRVRVVMASRFGDVGITTELTRERGYDERVDVSDLSNFGETPSGHARDCAWHCDQFEPECNCGKSASGTLIRQDGDATEIAAPLGSGPTAEGGDAQ